MNTKAPFLTPFWALTLLAICNVVLIIGHLAKDGILFPMVVMLLAVAGIWIASSMLRTGLLRLSAGLDDKDIQRLQQNALSVAMLGNAAILCAVPYIR